MKFSTHSKSAVLTATFATTLALTGCGDKTLDFRNAEINNGKVYAGNANSPFSGKVTNLPAGTVFGSQRGFGKLLNTVNHARQSTTLGDMGMTSLCDAEASDGVLNGKTVCKTAQSDTVRIEANFSGGVLDGSFVVHDQTGSNTFVAQSFKGGEPDGKMKLYSPTTGKLVHTATWEAGVLDGEEEGYDETTGNRVLHATLANGKYQGEFARYAPDGKRVVYRANFADGQLDGNEESFDPQTSQMIGQAHYVNGKLNGVARTWEATGKLIAEKTYEDGVDVAAAKAEAQATAAADEKRQHEPQDIEACVSKKREEVTQKNGGFAPPVAEMAWRDDCKREIDGAIADIKANVSTQPAPSQPAPTMAASAVQ
ncbi:toxin-antitoxin system YwqK family antitoxin [Burkholderia gladioli]|uniref:toxin-antitoxin system YwqK family antitoxin n=1 Tax=Burkholderia gladioli TaxID=28095 RepID=UPI0034DAF74C